MYRVAQHATGYESCVPIPLEDGICGRMADYPRLVWGQEPADVTTATARAAGASRLFGMEA